MKESSGCSLRDLFPGQFEHLERELRGEPGAREAERDGPLAWDYLASRAQELILENQDFDIFESLARGWAALRKLREYAREPKRAEDRTFDVALGKHEFTLQLRPTLTYQIGSLPEHSIPFDLALSVRVESVVLAILHGRIRAVGSADCSVTAQLKYRGIPLHDELKTQKVRAPGRIRLREPGLEISAG